MKVICIDASGHVFNYPLEEGAVYDVYQSTSFADSWKVVGFEFSKRGVPANYKKRRFIPLSNIDEMEVLENERQLVSSN